MAANGSEGIWFWPEDMDLNDFPDPVGFESAWKDWRGDLSSGPGVIAEVFAREFIQNSWDAIKSKSKEIGVAASSDSGVVFHFVNLVGKDAENFKKKFGLSSLEKRYLEIENEVREQKQLSDCFLSDGSNSIRLLLAVERGATGMYGKWDTESRADVQSSLLRHALLQTTSEKADQMSGGSWGHGKQGVAQGSKVRTIGAYTSYDQPQKDGTRDTHNAFLSATYWPRHQFGEKIYKGLGLIGTLSGGGLEFKSLFPLMDKSADGFIQELNLDQLKIRDPKKGETGTTFLILDPKFEPQDLAKAIARNWWPLIVRGSINIEVSDYSGNLVPIKPKDHDELKPFIRAFDLALKNEEHDENSEICQSISIDGTSSGELGLTSNTSDDGWSWLKTSESPNADLVALIRNDMVIAYQHFPLKRIRGAPWVRGAFVVDRDKNEQADKKLRLTEPHLHNEWVSSHSDKNSEFAKKVTAKINEKVSELRKKLLPDEPTTNSRIPAFSNLFIIEKGSSSRPRREENGETNEKSPYSIEYKIERDWSSDDPTKLRITASAKVSLSEHGKHEGEIMVTIDPAWKVMQDSMAIGSDLKDDSTLEVIDDRKGGAYTLCLAGGVARGELNEDVVSVTWTSKYFDAEWIVDPYLKITNVSGESDGEDE